MSSSAAEGTKRTTEMAAERPNAVNCGPAFSRLETATYIEAMAGEMSGLAERAGLKSLGTLLAAVSRSAALAASGED